MQRNIKCIFFITSKSFSGDTARLWVSYTVAVKVKSHQQFFQVNTKYPPMLTVSIFEVLSIAKVTFMFKVIFIFGVVFIFVQLHSEIANPTQLQLVGLGADFVFPCHKTTHPQQPMQHILSNMDKEMILHLGNFVAALECPDGFN